jgi:hypothetical protein
MKFRFFRREFLEDQLIECVTNAQLQGKVAPYMLAVDALDLVSVNKVLICFSRYSICFGLSTSSVSGRLVHCSYICASLI